jgi:glycerol-3-phosphate acyltransferase PlsY
MIINMLIALAGGYLLGSIPFGLVLTRLAGLGDIRDIGSGNIGATNVLRTGNKFIAILTLIFDAGKGALAYLLAAQWVPEAALIAGFGAFLGHLFPVWLKFNGGKGLATFLGLLFAHDLILGAIAIGTWLLVALIFRISSLSALVATLVSGIYALATNTVFDGIIFVLPAALIFLRHRSNIQRLLNGEEPRIGKS